MRIAGRDPRPEPTTPVTASSPAADLDDVSSDHRHRSPRASMWALLTCIAGASALIEVVGPLKDPDIWWHVRTGDLIVDTGHVPHHEPWAFAARGRPWVPNSWLSDVVLALAHRAGGWAMVSLVFLVVSAAVLAALGTSLHRTHAGPVAFAVFVITTGSVLIFLDERPQVVSLLLCVWLAGVCRRIMRAQSVRPWTYLLVVYLWTNLHGMWVLAPMSVALALLAVVADDPRRAWAMRWTAVVLVLGPFALAALTPAGPRVPYWFLVVRRAASGVTEWQPTPLWNHQSVWFVLLAGIVLTSWGLAAARPPRHELVWTLGVLALALSAGRNIAPASLLLAPFAADGLERVVGERLSERREPDVPRWTLLVPAGLAGAVLLGVVLAVPRLPTDLPVQTVDALVTRPQTPVRVLNDFNVGGVLTGLGAPKLSVALDGRIDNYAPAYIQQYWAVTRGIGLDDYLARWRPDAAVVAADSVLLPMLEQRGWRVTLRDHGWVTLLPSSAP